MTDAIKTTRRGRGLARSAFTLGAAGVLGLAGCQTADVRARPTPGSPPPVSV